jgi:hypothetical protein
MFFWRSHIFLLAILYASFGSLTQVPLVVEPLPGDSKKPQLEYFTLNYELYTNKSIADLDPIQITEHITRINTTINNFEIEEELKRDYGIILKAHCILYMESITTFEMTDFFKARLGADFLGKYLIKEMDYAHRIFISATFLVYYLTRDKPGRARYQSDCDKFLPDIERSNFNVESVIYEKIKNDATFFTLIFKDLLQNPDDSQVIPFSRFIAFLDEMIEFNNRHYPQPTDAAIKAKVEARAQFLFDKMKGTLAETERTAQDVTGETSSTPTQDPKPGEQTDKTPVFTDEEKARKEKEAKEQVIKDAKAAEHKAQKEAEEKKQADLKAQEDTEKLRKESEEQVREIEVDSKDSSNNSNTPDNGKAIKIALAIFCITAIIASSLAAYYLYGKRPTPSAA